MNDEAISFQQAIKSYKRFVLGPITIVIPKGYISGFIGKNGAGKTTLLRMINNEVKTESGNLRVHGYRSNEDRIAINERVIYVSEEKRMYSDFKVKQAIALMKSLYPRWNAQKEKELIKSWNIPTEERIYALSKGESLKFNLVIALCSGAQTLLLDEPTAGLDPVARQQLLYQCQNFMGNEEHTICISSHITSDLEQVADYLFFLKNGQIALQGEQEQLKEEFCFFQAPLTAALNFEKIPGYQKTEVGFTGVVLTTEREAVSEGVFRRPTLDELLYYVVEGGES